METLSLDSVPEMQACVAILDQCCIWADEVLQATLTFSFSLLWFLVCARDFQVLDFLRKIDFCFLKTLEAFSKIENVKNFLLLEVIFETSENGCVPVIQQVSPQQVCDPRCCAYGLVWSVAPGRKSILGRRGATHICLYVKCFLILEQFWRRAEALQWKLSNKSTLNNSSQAMFFKII